MKCKQVLILLPEIVIGRGSDSEKALVAKHLAQCSACKEEAVQMETILSDLQTIPENAPSNAYWSSLLPSIHARLEQKRAASSLGWVPRFALPASAAFVLVLMLINGQYFDRNPEQQVSALMQQLSPEEVQQVEDQATLSVESSGTALQGDQPQLLTGSDEQVLQDLLQSEDRSALYADLDLDETVNSLSEPEESQLLSVLQRN